MAYTELGWLEDGVGNLAAASEAASRAVAEERYWNSLILKTEVVLNWEGDVVQAKALLGQMPASALQEDYGIYEAMLLAWVQRDATAMLGLVASVPRDWLQSNFFEGPTQYFAGAAHRLANRAEAARQSWTRALQTVEKRLADTPDQPESLLWKMRLQAELGELAAAQGTFRLFKQVATRPVMRGERSFERAADLWLLGERDAALAHLEDCMRRNEVTWAQFQTAPTFEPMRSHPRFQALVEQARENPRLAPPHAREEKTAAKSIAVLAFENRSDDEFLASGITDDLSMVLNRVPGLRVAARTSSLYFKGKAMPVREIARELDVAYVVEGSVQKDGPRVKVNVTLIKAQDGFRVWSEQFVQELKEVLALQERIAAVIAQNLSLQLGAAGRSRERVDPRAFELYAEARLAWGTRTLEGFSRAERALLQAVEIAPRYAQAHAALVDVWGLRGQWSDRPSAWGLRKVPELARLLAKGEQALSYDPQLAEAKTALGGVYWSAWRFAEGERALREAIQLNPNHATAHQWLGRTLLTLGRMDEALASLATAAQLDPLAPRILDNYAWALILAGRIDQGLSVLERALALQPEADQARGLKAVALAMRGEREAAAVVARSVSNETSVTAWLRVQGLALAGEIVEAGTLLDGYREGNLTAKLCGLAALGRHEAVLQALDVDWLVSTRVDWLLFHPIFNPVRSDPRFQAAMATVGLTEAHARAQAWRTANLPEKAEAKR
jgi:TolB-like protein/cytochrome c-type biogenesis protein CcmH/NrfG